MAPFLIFSYSYRHPQLVCRYSVNIQVIAGGWTKKTQVAYPKCLVMNFLLNISSCSCPYYPYYALSKQEKWRVRCYKCGTYTSSWRRKNVHYLDFGVDTATVPDSVQHVAVTANTIAVIRARLFAGIYAGNLTFIK